MKTGQIDIKKWEQEHAEALKMSRIAYADVCEADKIQELHERVRIRTEARIRFDAADDKLTLLQQQWGSGWRNQNGEQVCIIA